MIRPKGHIKGVKTCKKHVTLVSMGNLSSLGVHIQDFAQTQQKFAQSHDCMTATFKNSASLVSISLKGVRLAEQDGES